MAAPVVQANESDLDLARAILARDRKATARLIELHTDSVHQYVWRRLAPKVDMVDDIVQDVFIAAWRSMQTYTGEAPLRSWLTGIARNKVEDYYRRRLNPLLTDIESQPEQCLAASVHLDEEVDANRQATRAAALLNELPEEYSFALRWRYWDGRSAREMAAATGKSEKAIERLLARARERFRLLWMRAQGSTPSG